MSLPLQTTVRRRRGLNFRNSLRYLRDDDRVDDLATYDRDVLEVGTIEGISIVTPAALVAALTPE
ncbi:MAG TPA: hypothetical protein VNM91_05260 [Dehalococcoidia bacterium]|nr:hypothetical protein [Dehalococcoidia bacterium]